MAGSAAAIRGGAEAVFGAGARPAAILLTHVHPDHAGATRELSRAWDCPVLVHEDELPLAVVRELATVERFANPLDRWLILPVMRALPRRWAEAALASESLAGMAQGLGPDGAVPGLQDWTCIPTPGHSPGHVAFFREADGILITGDAALTVELGSVAGFISWLARGAGPTVSRPPWYTNRDPRGVVESLEVLAALEPRVVAPGHGAPFVGDGGAALRACAAGARLRVR